MVQWDRNLPVETYSHVSLYSTVQFSFYKQMFYIFFFFTFLFYFFRFHIYDSWPFQIPCMRNLPGNKPDLDSLSLFLHTQRASLLLCFLYRLIQDYEQTIFPEWEVSPTLSLSDWLDIRECCGFTCQIRLNSAQSKRGKRTSVRQWKHLARSVVKT